MNKDKCTDFLISELFMVKASWYRTFIATIRREVDYCGEHVVFGEVIVHEGKISSKAASQEELEKNLDIICMMKLDYRLHASDGVKIAFMDKCYYLN